MKLSCFYLETTTESPTATNLTNNNGRCGRGAGTFRWPLPLSLLRDPQCAASQQLGAGSCREAAAAQGSSPAGHPGDDVFPPAAGTARDGASGASQPVPTGPASLTGSLEFLVPTGGQSVPWGVQRPHTPSPPREETDGHDPDDPRRRCCY